MDKSLLKTTIDQAGGARVVSRATGKSLAAVYKWIANGLPRTEWTGETRYADVICELASQNGSLVAPAELLDRKAA